MAHEGGEKTVEATSELNDRLDATGNVQRLLKELETAMSHTRRWSYWKPLILAAQREHRMLESAFDGQSRELEIALEFLTPETLTEFRRKAYPRLYPSA